MPPTDKECDVIQVQPSRSALVLVDLQNGVLTGELHPRSPDAVRGAAAALATRFRAAGAPVIHLNVGYAQDLADVPTAAVDRPQEKRPGGLPAGWSDPADGLFEMGDVRIIKHQWGGFWGTDLDLQLRRRKVSTLVLGGVATHMGVESTVREAFERDYEVVVVEDLCASRSPELHRYPVENILPLLARLTRSDAVTFAAA